MPKLIHPGKHFSTILTSANFTTGIAPVYQVIDVKTDTPYKSFLAETFFGRSQAEKTAKSLDTVQDMFVRIQERKDEYFPTIEFRMTQAGHDVYYTIIERKTQQVMHESFPAVSFIGWYLISLGALEAKRCERLNKGSGFIP